MEKVLIQTQENINALSCKICILPYDEQDHSPIVLICGHTLCKACLGIITTNNNNSNIHSIFSQSVTKSKCPFCKKELPKNAELILNYEIISLLHFKKFDNSCSLHNSELLNFYCEDDKLLICQYCLLKSHIGHKISKPEDSEIAKYIEMIEEFKGFEKGIREKKFKSNQSMKDVFKKVDDNFVQFSKVLQEIKNYIKFEYYLDFEKLKELVKDVEDVDKELNIEYEKLKSGGLSNSQDSFWGGFCTKFVILKEKLSIVEKIYSNNSNISMNNQYSTFTEVLSSITNLSNQIKNSEALATLSKPEYADIENIIEFLMDPRPSTIRYKLSTPMDNQNLFSNSSQRIEILTNMDQVLNILKSIDRAEFVGVSHSSHPYIDTPLRFGWNTTISAPHMHILTLTWLSKYSHRFKPNSTAIDIGSGSGYMTLAISKLLGPGSKIIALDHIQEIIDFSKTNIKKSHKTYFDSGRILFVCAEGRNGFNSGEHDTLVTENNNLPKPPYQIIHVGAACESIPEKMIEQLAPGGVMWIPIGPKGLSKKIMLVTKEENGEIKKNSLMDVNYAEMQSPNEQLGIEEGGSSEEDDEGDLVWGI